jgi:hypothetical protein
VKSNKTLIRLEQTDKRGFNHPFPHLKTSDSNKTIKSGLIAPFFTLLSSEQTTTPFIVSISKIKTVNSARYLLHFENFWKSFSKK